MIHLSIPIPPDPTQLQYRTNPLAWQRAVADWMQRTKGAIELSVNQLGAPCGQQFLSTSFTTNTLATGTTTGTDLANVVASLVQTLTDAGILSPTITRGQTQ